MTAGPGGGGGEAVGPGGVGLGRAKAGHHRAQRVGGEVEAAVVEGDTPRGAVVLAELQKLDPTDERCHPKVTGVVAGLVDPVRRGLPG